MARLKWLALLVCFIASLSRAQESSSQYAKKAQQEYAAVFSHPDQPCQWADNYGFLQCMNKEIDFTEAHLDAFVTAMKGIAAERDAAKPPDTNHKKAVDTLNQTDSSWRQYRKSACSLAFSFGPGTGAAPASANCELSMDRDYMKMLAGFFNLHELA